jgi:hypothetical protein
MLGDHLGNVEVESRTILSLARNYIVFLLQDVTKQHEIGSEGSWRKKQALLWSVN